MNISIQNKILLFGALLFAGLITFSACKKDPVDPGTGTFERHLPNYLDKNEGEEYNTIYTTNTGRKISLSLAQLYLSHIQLVKVDGSTYDITGHSGALPTGNLNLEAGMSYAELHHPGSGYVDTLKPTFSVLYAQMISVTNPIPPTGKLDQCTLGLILGWMEQGANSN